ncbi:Hypothetical predicted protein [Cloeon dipterum]|uniref:C2H2-type domain-containing protein n=2 Tax=Cloeon dipterum TaxID=197152 RepID=A0A8S1DG45_9INSE|nr:Hypothetical predicted protein [Cloeon dipterum]
MLLVRAVYNPERADTRSPKFGDERRKVVSRNGRYVCSICEVDFDRYNQCWEHVNQHVGVTTCHVCAKIFATTHSLRRHLTQVHANLVKKKKK